MLPLVADTLIKVFSVSWDNFNRWVACQDYLTAKSHWFADYLFMREQAGGWPVRFLSVEMPNHMKNTEL